ncbi:MAG: TM0106 family RecB-like putative nuclease [Chloroflexi bacterium]|nr:TM0106 family RecB-like putative nuclease [Chloroflexota bacterium]
MQLLDDHLVLSATDLVGYLACDHLATLELGRVAGLWERPNRRDDPTIALIQEKGDLHEADFLARLRAEGRSVVEIRKDDLKTVPALVAAATETRAAMQGGADVIYQATFFDGTWRGHADFLFKRTDRPSPLLGSWSYDIADTKLARSVKAGAVLQMCVYAGLLEPVQGTPPEWLVVITGDRVEHRHRAEDFAAYFRFVRARFEARIARDAADPAASPTYPDPVDHCRVCAWSPTCIQRRRDDDHLSIVAGMRRVDTERLNEGGVSTLAALAGTPPDPIPAGIPGPQFQRLRNQARLQLHERNTQQRAFELIEPSAGEGRRGLGLLPDPSLWDVFFDIEADPWANEAGLEYLLGVVTIDGGVPVYNPIWGRDATEERRAFEQFIDFVIARRAAHPDLHVFHYGGYESGAIKRLMQRHGTRFEEVDTLLRGDVLVDLLTVVRQGVRASVESYSLKQIEKFYMPVRDGPVTEAGFSVVEFERWLKTSDPSILAGIADYNRDDCVSTWMLRDWLEARRDEAIDQWPDGDWTRSVPAAGEASAAVSEWEARVLDRVDGLTATLDPVDTGEQASARRLLADVLDWHRREEKSQWWRYFELKDDTTVEELVAERDALGGLEFDGEEEPDGRLRILRYRFEPQDHPFKRGDAPTDYTTGGGVGVVERVDDARGRIWLRRRSGSWDHPVGLLGPKPIPSVAMREALLRVADDVIAHGIGDAGRYPAVAQLLLRRPPRIRGHEGGDLVDPDADLVAAARHVGRSLDRTVLPIQGPPGTGKTYTAARMITALVAAGARVAVTAQSHKTITNLLEEVLVAAVEPSGGGRPPILPRIIQKAGDLDSHLPPGERVTITDDGPTVDRAVRDGSVDVVGGTSWLLARAQLDAASGNRADPFFEVLFVDEAGQFSLANLLAVATCARSIVLVGDPNQLPMVTQGVHPPGADASALQHLVGGSVTVPPDRGLFLGVSRRLHPLVNAFVSPAFYEDRLTTHPSTAIRVVGGDGELAGAGIRWRPVVHAGDASRSLAEAEAVVDLVQSLMGRAWTDRDGATRTLDLDDAIVVAPYNAQVAEIQGVMERRMGRTGNVGTVDKFQGREGVVAIYSLASSSREDAPRDMTFLYSRHRLNVAVSRAESIAIIVASPTLLEAGCRTPEEMHLVDALCRFVETADAQARP